MIDKREITPNYRFDKYTLLGKSVGGTMECLPCQLEQGLRIEQEFHEAHRAKKICLIFHPL